jgi:23S rRNA pseudouridine1911/1915/1917 synthase
MRYEDLNILYEDNHLIAAVKPYGILSQADGSDDQDMLTLIKQYIKAKYNKPGDVWLGLVHRLDQPVGGVMVFARTSKAAARLSAQIRDHQTGKYYLAVVQGSDIPEQQILHDVLIRDKRDGRVRIADINSNYLDDGRNAELELKRLKTVEYGSCDLSLLEIKLGTGRGHQIRVQLAGRGWPILGDGRYGAGLKHSLNLPVRKTVDKSGREHTDLALFCCRMEFSHPVKHELLTISAKPENIFPWNVFQSSL